MGLYLEIYANNNSQRSVTKVGNLRKVGFASHRVLYAEPGAADLEIVDHYSQHPIRNMVDYYNDRTTKAIYKIKSRLELTRVLLMFEWEKLHDKE